MSSKTERRLRGTNGIARLDCEIASAVTGEVPLGAPLSLPCASRSAMSPARQVGPCKRAHLPAGAARAATASRA